MKPDDCHIATAELAAGASPCAKSKRGVALFDPDTGAHRGDGHNGPPAGAPCPGRAVCGDRCGKLCVHAEMRALREMWAYATNGHWCTGLHLVHVKLGPDGRVTPGGPPSCWQCSREILDVGFVVGVWLYERTWATCRADAGCPYCDGEACTECELAAACGNRREFCDPRHEPHYGLRSAEPRWRYYPAADFHAVTLRNARLA